jgi:hypothetical protein
MITSEVSNTAVATAHKANGKQNVNNRKGMKKEVNSRPASSTISLILSFPAIILVTTSQFISAYINSPNCIYTSDTPKPKEI